MLAGLLLVAAAPLALPTDFGPCPAQFEPFCRHLIQVRAAEGLNRVVHDPQHPKHGTVYGGAPEDANIAWVAAAAYRWEWSRFHQSQALRDEAFFLLDALARIRANGRWDDGGLNAYFGLHSFAWAVLEWLETGAVDPARQAAWKAAVAAAAEDAMVVLSRSLTVGNYANPEFYYLSGLAAAWQVTGQERYREEALRALHRYDDRLWANGAVPYFHESSPEHGYQQMLVKSVALLHDLTADASALEWLQRMADYFPLVMHRSGLVTDGEVPHLKHGLYVPVNPGVPALLAALTGDGRNTFLAEVAAAKRADNVNNQIPAYWGGNPNWYNFHHTTYAVAALRVLAKRRLPPAVEPVARRVLFDAGFRGGRSHWDDFAAAVGTRAMNDSLACASVADPAEPMFPLGAAVSGVFFEVLQGDRSPQARPDIRTRARFGVVEWSPTVTHNAVEGFASTSCLTRLCSPYWNDQPWLPGEKWPLNEVSSWSSIQHWAVWRDHLVGLGALLCHAEGGDARTADRAQVRVVHAPQGRAAQDVAVTEEAWSGEIGSLAIRLQKLGGQGSWRFGDEAAAAPAGGAVVLAREAPWKTGDGVQVACDVHPAASDSQVVCSAVQDGAAALLIEPDGREAWLWVVNLTRHFRGHELALPPGYRAQVWKRSAALPPPAAGQAVGLPLSAAEGAVARITAAQGIDPAAVLGALHPGWGRGEAVPPRP